MIHEKSGSGFAPWAGGEGPNAWKMNRFLGSTEPITPVVREPMSLSQDMTEGVEVDLRKNPNDLGKGNDFGNPQLW